MIKYDTRLLRKGNASRLRCREMIVSRHIPYPLLAPEVIEDGQSLHPRGINGASRESQRRIHRGFLLGFLDQNMGNPGHTMGPV